MLRFVVCAACLAAAVPAFAQTSGTPTPQASPPASQRPNTAQSTQAPAMTGAQLQIQQTAMAFGQCIQAGVRGLAGTVTPEAGATAVLGGCAAQKTALEGAAQGYIATLPEDQRAAAQEQLTSHLGGVEAQVAAAIRAQRAAAASPATPPATQPQ